MICGYRERGGHMEYQKESDEVTLLMKTPLFEGIDPKDVANMVTKMDLRWRKYSKGTHVVNRGDVFDGMGVVEIGEVMVLKESIGGERTIMTVIEPTGMFGEMICFSTLKHWPATVVAKDHVRILFFRPSAMLTSEEGLNRAEQQVIQHMMHFMAKRALLLSRRLEILSCKSLKSKITAYLVDAAEASKENPQKFIQLSLNRNELADLLNVARPSISRELACIKKEGLIDYYKSTIKIIDLEGLKQILSS